MPMICSSMMCGVKHPSLFDQPNVSFHCSSVATLLGICCYLVDFFVSFVALYLMSIVYLINVIDIVHRDN